MDGKVQENEDVVASISHLHLPTLAAMSSTKRIDEYSRSKPTMGMDLVPVNHVATGNTTLQ